MKAYEMLPASMSGSGGCGAKKPKPYEIPPASWVAGKGLGGINRGSVSGGKSGGCGCGGSCGDKGKKAKPKMGKWPLATVFPPLSSWNQGKGRGKSSIFPTSAGVVQLGPGQSPGASLCAALAGQISDLRDEINRRYDQYGDDRDAVERLVQQMGEFCDGDMPTSDLQAICNALSNAIGTLTGDEASAMAAMANACSCSLPYAQCAPGTRYSGEDFQTVQLFACLTLQQGIDKIERELEEERQMSLEWHYRYDIAPLQQRLQAMELSYTECASAAARWPWPPTPPGDPSTCGELRGRPLKCLICCSEQCGPLDWGNSCYDDCSREQCGLPPTLP